MFNRVRLAVPTALIVVAIAACGGSAAPTTRPTATAGQPTATAGQPTATTGVVASAICRTLDDLTNMDYAFGKPFTIVQSLDAASKALTVQHLIAFAASAPPELAQAAADLVGLWSQLKDDPTSVSESDPRWASTTTSINAWRDANC